jgi:hypothetical protein
VVTTNHSLRQDSRHCVKENGLAATDISPEEDTAPWRLSPENVAQSLFPVGERVGRKTPQATDRDLLCRIRQ